MVAGEKGHRCFAACYDALTRAEGPAMKALRRQVVGGATGRVLEVGVGPGVNLPFYPTEARVTAVDPDPHMLKRARRAVQAAGLTVDLRAAAAEALPFPDGAFETVVCSLVLCSVPSQARALAEVRRVLAPGGTLRFLEHVRGNGIEGYLWDAITPLWRLAAAGCHPNRRTEATIRAAGFSLTEIQHTRLPDALPAIMGSAQT